MSILHEFKEAIPCVLKTKLRRVVLGLTYTKSLNADFTTMVFTEGTTKANFGTTSLVLRQTILLEKLDDCGFKIKL